MMTKKVASSNDLALHKGLLMQDWVFRLGTSQLLFLMVEPPKLFREALFNQEHLKISWNAFCLLESKKNRFIRKVFLISVLFACLFDHFLI